MTSDTESSVDGPTVVLAYHYNAAGLRDQMAATIDGTADFVDDYGYDAGGRLISISEHAAVGGNPVEPKEIDLQYNDDGNLTEVTRYLDGVLAVEADYSYDAYGRLLWHGLPTVPPF